MGLFKKDPKLPVVQLLPSLQERLEREGLVAHNSLCVGLETDGHGHIRVQEKHSVPVTDGKKAVRWPVASLAELFRGDRPPPPDIEHYPPEYVPYFFFIENHFLTLCDAQGDRSDQEMEEIYTALRRRPEGRSLGAAHDFTWQVLALLLGKYALSQAELNGILDALIRSTRKWSVRPISRNYAGYLRRSFRK